MRVGFVCAWEPGWPEATWSGTPWALRAAMRERAEVVDIDPGLPRPIRAALKLAYYRPLARGWSSSWKWSRPAEAMVAARMNGLTRRAAPDVVLQMGDYGAVPRPFYLYQDAGFGFLDIHYDEFSPYLWVDRASIHRRADRQRRIYDRASGLLAMSEWMAEDVVARGDIDGSKVVVVGAGLNSAPAPGWSPTIRPATERRRLLFVGREFLRKGGDVVLAALERLRLDHDPGTTLTVVGPERWPLAGEIPAGVTFRGRIPFSEVGALYRDHDLFVMPSRFDPSPLVLTEALAHGMPCVARRAFAMPERVRPGHNGELVDGDDADELATAVRRVLADDSIYDRCLQEMAQVLRDHSWEAVAGRVVTAMAGMSSGQTD